MSEQPNSPHAALMILSSLPGMAENEVAIQVRFNPDLTVEPIGPKTAAHCLMLEILEFLAVRGIDVMGIPVDGEHVH